MMWWGDGPFWGWTMMCLFGLLGVVLLVGLIVLIVVAIKAVAGPSGGGSAVTAQTGRTESQTPLEILKARYARGEITREEYEQMRQDLEST